MGQKPVCKVFHGEKAREGVLAAKFHQPLPFLGVQGLTASFSSTLVCVRISQLAHVAFIEF